MLQDVSRYIFASMTAEVYRFDRAKVREARKAKGLSQVELARLLRTSQPRVSFRENGAPVRWGTVQATSAILNKDPAELLQAA